MSNGIGRDGQKLRLTHRTLVTKKPGHADEWAAFDTSHPIERMRIRGTLGGDQAQAFARYRAARVWFVFFVKAMGIGSSKEFLQESIDGTPDPEASILSRLDASMQRLNVMDATEMSPRSFDVLDSVCGYGRGISEAVRAIGCDPKTARKDLISGLDKVSGYPFWDKHLQAVQVLAVEPRPRKAG